MARMNMRLPLMKTIEMKKMTKLPSWKTEGDDSNESNDADCDDDHDADDHDDDDNDHDTNKWTMMALPGMVTIVIVDSSTPS